MVAYSSVVTQQVERNFNKWQQSLVEIKRTANPPAQMITRQQRFVDAAESSDNLAAYLRHELGVDSVDGAEVPALERVTADEMINFPFEWEHHVASQLQHIDTQRARSSVWWYICHIVWLEQGVFPNPPDMAFGARVNPRILKSDPEAMPSTASKKLDAATRNLLRRLGGLPHIRHQNRVAEDPPIPRAYWRSRLASDAASNAPVSVGITAQQCHRILRVSPWGRFIESSSNRYSSLLAPRALLAVCSIAQSNKKGVEKEHLQAIARRCLQAHPALMDWETLARPYEAKT